MYIGRHLNANGRGTMYPCDKEVLEQLLVLINHDECELALKTWSEYRHKVDKTCDHCPYIATEPADDCCMCLESKLRMLSLYEHGQDVFEETLLNAARKFNAFHH